MANTKAMMSIQERIAQQITQQNIRMPVNTGPNRIKLAGCVFTLPDGSSNEGPLDAIILDFTFVNSFFEGVYNANTPAPPVCSARNRNANEMVPMVSSSKPQNETCEGCAQNEYPPQGGGKPCKNGITVALVAADLGPDAPIMTLDVSPTGIKGFLKYIEGLAHKGNAPLQVITKISFDDKVTYPKLVFGDPTPHVKLEEAFACLDRAKIALD